MLLRSRLLTVTCCRPRCRVYEEKAWLGRASGWSPGATDQPGYQADQTGHGSSQQGGQARMQRAAGRGCGGLWLSCGILWDGCLLPCSIAHHARRLHAVAVVHLLVRTVRQAGLAPHALHVVHGVAAADGAELRPVCGAERADPAELPADHGRVHQVPQVVTYLHTNCTLADTRI